MPLKRAAACGNADEQTAKLRRRAMLVQNRGMVQELMNICKERIDLVPHILQHAYSLGAPRSSTGGMLGDSPPGPAIVDDETPQKPRRAGDSGSAIEPSPGHKRGEVDNMIPRCHQVWSSVPPQYFVHVLSCVEPISLSAQQLKVVAPPKSKHIPKALLLELWEAVTNCMPDDEVPAPFRDISRLTAAVLEFNTAQGRPCAQVLLPADWSQAGKYELQLATPPYTVTKKATKESKPIPKSFLDSASSVASIYITKNFSEREATIVDPNGFVRCPLSSLFPDIKYMIVACAPSALSSCNESTRPSTSGSAGSASPSDGGGVACKAPPGARGHVGEDGFVPPLPAAIS